MPADTVFVVLTNAPPPGRGVTNQFLTSGVYATLKDISGFIAPNGPPLPMVVQCTADQVPDLIPLAEKLQAVGNGTTVDNAEAFVKGVIEEVRDMTIWTTIPLFYGLVSSPSVKKLVAPNYKSVVDYISGTQDFTLHTFPTFIRAFIYVLAGGNSRLQEWGLIEWLGVPRVRGAPSPRSPLRLPSSSSTHGASFTPSSQQTLLGKLNPQGLKSTNNQGRGDLKDAVGDSDEEIVVAPDHYTQTARKGKGRSGASTKAEYSGQGVAQGMPAMLESLSLSLHSGTAPPTPLPFSLPSHLVPPTFLRGKGVQAKPLPFITYRPEGEQRFTIFTLTDSPSIPNMNGPLRAHPALPTFVYLYLLSHGWGNSIIEAVSIALISDATRTEFLNRMGRLNMPLAEATFLWCMMEYFKA